MSSPVPDLLPADGVLLVDERLSIPRSELEFRASRSGGAGGQHVNTSSTRIELLWDIERSQALAQLDPALRDRIRDKLTARLDAEGRVRVVASDRRSQGQNRESAESRLVELVRRALVVPKARKATRPTRASKEKRIQEKKRRSETKKNRRGLDD